MYDCSQFHWKRGLFLSISQDFANRWNIKKGCFYSKFRVISHTRVCFPALKFYVLIPSVMIMKGHEKLWKCPWKSALDWWPCFCIKLGSFKTIIPIFYSEKGSFQDWICPCLPNKRGSFQCLISPCFTTKRGHNFKNPLEKVVGLTVWYFLLKLV